MTPAIKSVATTNFYVGQASHLVINQTTAEFHVGGVSTHRGLQLLNEA